EFKSLPLHLKPSQDDTLRGFFFRAIPPAPPLPWPRPAERTRLALTRGRSESIRCHHLTTPQPHDPTPMPRPKVFVARRIPDEGLNAIRAACDVDLWPDQLPPSYEVLRDRVKDCDGLVSLLTDRIDGPLLDASPRLKVVSNYAVGFNNVDVPACTARGVCVGNAPGVLTNATADTAVTLLLAAA